MAYRIDYSQPGETSAPANDPFFRRLLLGLGFFCLFCLLVAAFWPEGGAVLRELLLGPDAAVLQQLDSFAAALQSTGSFREAAVAFCREALYGS